MGTRPASRLAKKLKAYSQGEGKFHQDYAELEVWILHFEDGKCTRHSTEVYRVPLINTHDDNYYAEYDFVKTCILMKVTIHALGQMMVQEKHEAMTEGQTYCLNVKATLE